MTGAEHQDRHRDLHADLTELLEDYRSHNPGTGAANTVGELLSWSALQVHRPTALRGRRSPHARHGVRRGTMLLLLGSALLCILLALEYLLHQG